MRKEYDFSKMKRVKLDFTGKEIVLADHDGVDKYRDAVNKILKAVGHPEALVTDESQFRHFVFESKDYRRLSKKFKMDIQDDTLIVTVAKKIFEDENTK